MTALDQILRGIDRYDARERASAFNSLTALLNERSKAALRPDDTDYLAALDARIRDFVGSIPMNVAEVNDRLRQIARDLFEDAALERLQNRRRRGEITPSGIESEWEPIRDKYLARVERVQAVGQATVDRAEAVLDSVRNSTLRVRGDSTAQLLEETRGNRVWARLEKRLATSDAKIEVVRSTIETATDDMRPTVIRIIIEEAVPTLIDAGLTDAEHQVWAVLADFSPELAAARENVTRAMKFRTVVDFNCRSIATLMSKLPQEQPSSRGPATFDAYIAGATLAEPSI